MTAGLTQDNVKAVQEVFKLCEQRQAAKRSKSIEQAGGKYKKFVKNNLILHRTLARKVHSNTFFSSFK